MTDAQPAANPPGPPQNTVAVVPADVHDAAVITKQSQLKDMVTEVVQQEAKAQDERTKQPFTLFGLPSWMNVILQTGAIGVIFWFVMVRSPAQEAQYHADLEAIRTEFHNDLKDIRDTDERRLATLYELLGEVKKRNTEKPSDK